MTRTLRWLLGMLLVFAILYGVLLYVDPNARPWKRLPRPRPAPREGGPRAAGRVDPASHDTVVVTLEIPAAADVPRGATHGGNCPKDRLCNILGITLASTHGLMVGSVVPDGPADRAGIKVGDMLAGRSMCPASVLPRFLPRAEPREMELTVRRAPGTATESTEGEELAGDETGRE